MYARRWLSIVAVSLLVAACAPAAPQSPTTAPAKPAATTAPAKPAESKPAATAAPAKPAEAKPAAQPTEKPAAKTAAPKTETKPAAGADSDFYRGKTITLLAGSSPGGGTDTIVRTISRHLGKHIPGNPNIIVQNVSGGGGMIALNNMVNNMPADGLTFNGSISQTLLYAQLQGTEQVRYDLTKLTWVGSAIDDSQVLWVRSDTPYTDIQAIRNAAEPPKLGAQSGTHSSVVLPKIVQEVTGLEFNVVAGYPGSPEIFLDVERGALDGRLASYGSLKTQRPEWLETNFIRILLFTGEQRHPELPDVPTIFELIPPERENLNALIRGPQQSNRSMAGAPGIPENIAKMVQDAYKNMSEDPAFVAEMQQAGFDTGYASPDNILTSLRQLMEDQDLRTTLNRILEG